MVWGNRDFSGRLGGAFVEAGYSKIEVKGGIAVHDITLDLLRSVTIDLFIFFMYLDMVLTLFAYLHPRSREMNILLGPLFRKNIYAFWMIGIALKTLAVLAIVYVFVTYPNIGLLLTCMVGGGALTACLLNILMTMPSFKVGPMLDGLYRPVPVSDRMVIPGELIPMTGMVIPRRVRISIGRYASSTDELGPL